MIDYREFDCIEDEGYDFFIDGEGVIYKVGLPKQKDLIKVYKLFYVLGNLQEEYNKIVKSKKINESSFDKIDNLYGKVIKVSYDLFLVILNLNTQNKEFKYEDVKGIKYENIQEEINNYLAYVNEKTKN